MAVGSSESLWKVPLRNRFLWTTCQNSSLSLTPILPTNHDYDIGSQQTPNKPNHQMPAATPARTREHERRQRRSRKPDAPTSRSRKPDAAPSAQMQLRCGSDAGHMRLRCRSYAAQMRLRCGSDAAQMWLCQRSSVGGIGSGRDPSAKSGRCQGPWQKVEGVGEFSEKKQSCFVSGVWHIPAVRLACLFGVGRGVRL